MHTDSHLPSSPRTRITNRAKALKKSVLSISGNTIPTDSLTEELRNGYHQATESPRTQNNPYRKFINDYNTLLYSFPGFPDVMMKALILREQGNMYAVAKFLKSRGWGNPTSQLTMFDDKTNQHITAQYFWGIDKPEYCTFLENKPVGTYFIVLSPPAYLIYFLTEDGISTQRVSNLNINSINLSNLPLYAPLKRDDSISIMDLLIF